MKDVAHLSENNPVNTPSSPATEALHKKMTATEKGMQKALADCEAKSAAYEEALKHPTDKATLLELWASAKIARLTYKIKRTEHKLAKAAWKAASKADKKAAEKPSKDGGEPRSKKATHKSSKDTAAKGKNSTESGPSGIAKPSKKKAAVQVTA